MLRFGLLLRGVGLRRGKLMMRGLRYKIRLGVRREGRRREWRMFEGAVVVILMVCLRRLGRHLI